FGLALLPFIIPLVWIAAPIVTGVEPNVSLAVPIALAVTAATLSLAVVSTVDWTPSTRVKGVLMIVGLPYFSATTPSFLQADAIELVKENLRDPPEWRIHEHDDYRVLVPGEMLKDKNVDPLSGWDLIYFRHRTDDEPLSFVVGSEELRRPFRMLPIRFPRKD